MTAEKTTIEEIQEQYNKLKKKSEFIIKLGKAVDREPNTIRTHWIGQLWAVPKDLQEQVLDEINKELKLQSNGNVNTK